MPTFNVEEITPEKAKHYLVRRPRERRLNSDRVRRYAEAMRADEWQDVGDPIRFDVNGALIDGQHRLAAIALSGCTIACMIARGLPPEAIEAIDQGRPRRYADLLKINGEKYHDKLASAVTYSLLLEMGKALNHGREWVRIPAQKQHLEENGGLRESVDEGLSLARQIGGPAALWAALIYRMRKIDKADGDDFVERMKKGANLEYGDPVLSLRTVLLHEKSVDPKRRIDPTTKAAYWIKAWNAYRAGRDLKQMKWRRGGANPEPFPTMDDTVDLDDIIDNDLPDGREHGTWGEAPATWPPTRPWDE